MVKIFDYLWRAKAAWQTSGWRMARGSGFCNSTGKVGLLSLSLLAALFSAETLGGKSEHRCKVMTDASIVKSPDAVKRQLQLAYIMSSWIHFPSGDYLLFSNSEISVCSLFCVNSCAMWYSLSSMDLTHAFFSPQGAASFFNQLTNIKNFFNNIFVPVFVFYHSKGCLQAWKEHRVDDYLEDSD